jgi:putative NADPH-quinone reductase
MGRRIAIIQGHPDGSTARFCHALAAAYEESARAAGHDVRRIEVAAMDIAPLRSRRQWQDGGPSAEVAQAQQTIEWAEHLVIFYPLWLGSMPALLKAFFEQVFRPGFAVDRHHSELVWHKRLRGRSARIVVTMGMPVLIYRFYFLSHSLKTLERNILGFCGIRPVRASLIGLVDAPDPGRRNGWLQKMTRLGYKGA